MKLAHKIFLLLLVGASTVYAADPPKDVKGPADPKATASATTTAPAATAAAQAASPAKPVAGLKLAASSPYQVELKAFRWRKHPKKNYERLVLEFVRKDKGTAAASAPSVVPAATGKEATIVMNGVSLLGDANDGKVSDTYGSKSSFMGPLSILADSAGGGFNVKIGLKNTNVVAEAQWLESPSRLVIDVFASVSDRNAIHATTPDNTDSDEKVAAEKTSEKVISKIEKKAVEPTTKNEPVTEKKARGTPSDTATTAPERSLFAALPPPPKKPRRHPAAAAATTTPVSHEARHQDTFSRDESYLCFPANAQVGLSVYFQTKNNHNALKEEVRLDIDTTNQKAPTASAIVCYPASAQVEATISYRDDKPLSKTVDSGEHKDGREPAASNRAPIGPMK